MELVFWCDLKDIVWVVVHVSYLKHLKVPGGCSVFLLVVCQERFPLILSADAASVSLLFPSHTCSVFGIIGLLLVVCQERFPLILSADAASVSLRFPLILAALFGSI